MSNNTLESRLMSLHRALSQMMRNTSEKQIMDELTTYRIAIQTTLKILNKKQKQTISLSASEYEDELEKGNL
jgi:hypothetical protein